MAEDWDKTPIANAFEARNMVDEDTGELKGYVRTQLFKLWFGAYGTTHVYVWADHLEDALEEAIDWLDDTGQCGVFTFLDEDDFRAAAEEQGYHPRDIDDMVADGSWPDDVIEAAEADLMVVGHTTLKCGEGEYSPPYIPNWEWGGGEVTEGSEEFQAVLERSLDEPEGSYAESLR